MRCVLACVRAGVEGSARLLGRSGPGAVVVVDIAGSPHRFVPLWAGEGFPRDVKIAVRMAEDLGSGNGAASVVVAASALSAGARQWLDSQGFGWADETGAYHLTGPGLDVAALRLGGLDGQAWRSARARRAALAGRPFGSAERLGRLACGAAAGRRPHPR